MLVLIVLYTLVVIELKRNILKNFLFEFNKLNLNANIIIKNIPFELFYLGFKLFCNRLINSIYCNYFYIIVIVICYEIFIINFSSVDVELAETY